MQFKKMLILVTVIAIAAVVIGFIVTGINTSKGPDGSYNYEVEFTDSFEGRAGTVTADTGKSFAIVEITLRNSGYSDGIETDVLVLTWRMTLDRVTYNANPAYTALHPDYWDVTVEKGKTWGYTVVFVVSEDYVGKKDLSIGYKYATLGDNKPSLTYDKDLTLPTDTLIASPVSVREW